MGGNIAKEKAQVREKIEPLEQELATNHTDNEGLRDEIETLTTLFQRERKERNLKKKLKILEEEVREKSSKLKRKTDLINELTARIIELGEDNEEIVKQLTETTDQIHQQLAEEQSLSESRHNLIEAQTAELTQLRKDNEEQEKIIYELLEVYSSTVRQRTQYIPPKNKAT